MKTATQTLSRLRFRTPLSSDYATIARYMGLMDSRTCDYTFGGIVLWAPHFGYRIAEADNTLYISGGREDDLTVRAYALPVGDADLTSSVRLLKQQTPGADVWFSAVPEDRLHLFAAIAGADVSELGPEWSDYLYDIRAMASLSGGAMKKKRNHVNRFLADNPDAQLTALDGRNAAECMELLHASGHDSTPTGISEFAAVETMLDRWSDFAPWLCGSVLTAGGRVRGFTVGEVKDDTLHVHVEKCDHSVAGANEALASMFASEMLARNQRLLYVNRQDDAGEPGLRASKESWHPLRLLPKFNVMVGRRA